MSVKTCAHVLDNGTVCKSPALGEHKYCYFHIRLHQKPQRRKDGSTYLLLNDLTCVESIQIAISNVLHATNDGLIDSKTANSLYRGLGMALSALRLKLAQQKFEASQNDDSEPRPRRDPFSQIMSLLDTASPSADGSRSPSSGTFQENVERKEESVESNDVILTANEVSRKDPVSATASLSAPGNSHQQPSCSSPDHQIANGPMAQSPDGPIDLTSVLPEKKVKALKRILRRGPRHPLFHSAAAQLERHGSAVANARNTNTLENVGTGVPPVQRDAESVARFV